MMRPHALSLQDPTCARLHLRGTARAISSKAELAKAEAAFAARHPLAPWLGGGGAHTGGAYYALEPTSLAFLDYYGGYAKLSLKEYLAAPTPSAASPAAQASLVA